MKKTIVAIFAHPDDESFGPAGTIATLSKNNDVYVLCATKGESGNNQSEKVGSISQIREEEVRESSKQLGVKDIFFLGFQDGCLCNNTYHTLAEAITTYTEDLRPEILLTFEPRGLTGHIDHIAMSMITTYVFIHSQYSKKLMYYCLSKEHRDLCYKNYFVYFPEGYDKNDVDEVVDISAVWDTKIKAIQCHTSQKKDIECHVPIISQLPKEEYFLVKTK